MRGGRLLVAGALCLPVLALSACQSTEEPLGAPSASPAQTLITPHARKPKPAKKAHKTVHSVAGGTTKGLSRSQLDAVVTQANSAIRAQLTPAMKQTFLDVRVDPVYPNGLKFTYVFRKAVPPGTASQLSSGSGSFQDQFAANLGPLMEASGVKNASLTFVFENPDGSVIWSRKFTG